MGLKGSVRIRGIGVCASPGSVRTVVGQMHPAERLIGHQPLRVPDSFLLSGSSQTASCKVALVPLFTGHVERFAEPVSHVPGSEPGRDFPPAEQLSGHQIGPYVSD